MSMWQKSTKKDTVNFFQATYLFDTWSVSLSFDPLAAEAVGSLQESNKQRKNKYYDLVW